MTVIWNRNPALPEEPAGRPILERLRARSDMDWGEAPNYNAEYRKIRWQGTPSTTTYFRPLTQEEATARLNRRAGWSMIGESPFMRGHVETESDDPDITVTRRMRHAPSWQETIRRQIILKAEGRWTRNMSRQQLRRDMELCMSQNIPFKTKTFEYKPSDQWLYVHGRRVLKFDLMTGYISHFTYSGVYNKVTSLLLRLFDIKVKLKGRKLTWFADRVRPGARPSPVVPFAEEVDIDLNRVYTFGDFFMNVPPWRGFHKVSATLFNEFYRVEQENGNEQP